MIKSRMELKEYLEYERKLYFKDNLKSKIEKYIVMDKDIYIYRFVKYLRKSEYYYNTRKYIFGNIMYLYYRRKKNKLGIKLGIEAWENCFEKGLKIWHTATIVVNGETKIGSNCEIKGDLCIGNNGKNNLSPKIGNDVQIGNGAKIIGDITIGNKTIIGAGTVVTKSFIQNDNILVGVPAKKINNNGD